MYFIFNKTLCYLTYKVLSHNIGPFKCHGKPLRSAELTRSSDFIVHRIHNAVIFNGFNIIRILHIGTRDTSNRHGR